MEQGLDEALPDDRLGPGGGAIPSAPDLGPIGRDPVGARSGKAVDYRATTRFRIERDDGSTFQVTEQTRLRQADSGDFDLEVVREVNRPGGREQIVRKAARYVAGSFYTQGADGTWVLRNPMREHHLTWRAEAASLFPLLVQLLGPRQEEEAGQGGRRIRLVARAGQALNPSAIWRDSIETWPAWWAGVHKVVSLSGGVRIDAECECPQAGELTVTLDVNQPGHRGSVRIEHEFTADLPVRSPVVHPPEDAHVPRRRRVVEMVREVLGQPSSAPADPATPASEPPVPATP
jgi:hypothetical protein